MNRGNDGDPRLYARGARRLCRPGLAAKHFKAGAPAPSGSRFAGFSITQVAARWTAEFPAPRTNPRLYLVGRFWATPERRLQQEPRLLGRGFPASRLPVALLNALDAKEAVPIGVFALHPVRPELDGCVGFVGRFLIRIDK